MPSPLLVQVNVPQGEVGDLRGYYMAYQGQHCHFPNWTVRGLLKPAKATGVLHRVKGSAARNASRRDDARHAAGSARTTPCQLCTLCQCCNPSPAIPHDSGVGG